MSVFVFIVLFIILDAGRWNSPLVAMGHGGGDQGPRDAKGLAGRGGELGELESRQYASFLIID